MWQRYSAGGQQRRQGRQEGRNAENRNGRKERKGREGKESGNTGMKGNNRRKGSKAVVQVGGRANLARTLRKDFLGTDGIS